MLENAKTQNLPRCWGRAGKGPFSNIPCSTVRSEAKKQAMRRVSRNMSALDRTVATSQNKRRSPKKVFSASTPTIERKGSCGVSVSSIRHGNSSWDSEFSCAESPASPSPSRVSTTIGGRVVGFGPSIASSAS